jgi:hypothetical protein
MYDMSRKKQQQATERGRRFSIVKLDPQSFQQCQSIHDPGLKEVF